MVIQTNDIRIAKSLPLIPPSELKAELPLTEAGSKTVSRGRELIDHILKKEDHRMLGIIGPCSIHDPKAALEYAKHLKDFAQEVRDRLILIMRVYFEKPRTTIGWRGLITDPHLDGSYDIAHGLKTARKLLLDITDLGLPVGSEMLDPIVPQYIADLISWASIGARTTESQTHREMASGLSMPVGFKNSTDGNYELALDALRSSAHPHSFIGIDQKGQTCVLQTAGNSSTHIILRGGRNSPNYYEENVEEVEKLFQQFNIEPAIVVDCSHANSGKKPERQERVLRSIIDQRVRGKKSIIGFMIESNLEGGKQTIPQTKQELKYGLSITDGCIGWEKTRQLLQEAYAMLKEEQ